MSDFKVYTKTGDSGKTSLLGGARVAKYDNRIELYGEVDHLNSILGIGISSLSKLETLVNVDKELKTIQNILFDIGSNFACPHEKREIFKLYQLNDQDIEALEQSIDSMEEKLPALTNFILPGGALSASYIHLARTTCRMVERKLVSFSAENADEIPEIYIRYFNRLSDYFFVLARYVNLCEGRPDELWVSRA